jgi:hypothetical protein
MRHALVEPLPLARKAKSRSLPRSSRSSATRSQRFNTFKDRFRLQHHAFAAAKWAVIHGLVAIMRKRPQIVDFNLPPTPLPEPGG